MAVDTAAKRFRAMNFGRLAQPGLPLPSGTIDADARSGLLHLYLSAVVWALALSPAELAALQSGTVQIGVFFRLETDDPVRLWLGIGPCNGGINALDTSGQNYLGVGQLVNVPAFQQLNNGAAEVATFSLSGVNHEIIEIAAASASRVQGKRCYVGYGIQDSNWQLIGEIHWSWLTFADYISIDQSPQPDINAPMVRTASLAVSSTFTGRRRRGLSYFTDQDQQRRSPGDTFCFRGGYYSRLVNKTWPRF